VDAMLASIDSAQFTEWIAYANLHPFGHENRLLAQLPVIICNYMRPPNSDPIEIDAFLPISLSQEEQRQRMMDRGLEEARKRNADIS
jgi:hypothetical protein